MAYEYDDKDKLFEEMTKEMLEAIAVQERFSETLEAVKNENNRLEKENNRLRKENTKLRRKLYEAGQGDEQEEPDGEPLSLDERIVKAKTTVS